MNFIKSACLLLSVGLFIAACAETQTNNTHIPSQSNSTANLPAQTGQMPSESASARIIYLETCVGCHRENGEGGVAEFEGKKIKVPSYTSKGAMNASDDKLYNYIANGEEGEMPAFKGKLTEEQMKNLVKFIRQEFQNK